MTRQERIVAFLQERGRATFPQINQHLECGRSTASFAVADALKAGAIRRIGERRHYVYSLPGYTQRVASVFDLAFG